MIVINITPIKLLYLCNEIPEASPKEDQTTNTSTASQRQKQPKGHVAAVITVKRHIRARI
ncbi:hypothetical protein TSAR_016900 [Trichomalopsis sarcophagae]|uniref:Uncharacterized protein n=1 Tax=Trichomalopsis sarcophagae TaxID=543379 RepID=A0A232EHQ4_9HYME|nr:hypothetical protein TSAR_016900 [Trichomalopsis sarcophagae]